MSITKETMQQLSALSRLSLTEEETEQLARELETVVTYMDILGQLPTGDVEPLSHVFPVKNVLRADELAPSLPRSELLSGAPACDGETFLVPQTVE